MPKDYLDPEENPFILVDEDNPGSVPPKKDDGPLMSDPEGYGMPEIKFGQSAETKIKDFMKDRDFFAVYGPGDQFLYSVKVDEAGRVVVESGGQVREPSQDEIKQIAEGIDNRR